MTTLTLASWSQYYNLTKPKVVLLIVFTAMVGMLLAADGAPPLDVFVFGLVGIGLGPRRPPSTMSSTSISIASWSARATARW